MKKSKKIELCASLTAERVEWRFHSRVFQGGEVCGQAWLRTRYTQDHNASIAIHAIANQNHN